MTYRSMGAVPLSDDAAKQICQGVLVGTWDGSTRQCGAPYMSEPLISAGCTQVGGAWDDQAKVCTLPEAVEPGPPGVPGVPGIPTPSWTPPTPPPQEPPPENSGLDVTKVAIIGAVAVGAYYLFFRKKR